MILGIILAHDEHDIIVPAITRMSLLADYTAVFLHNPTRKLHALVQDPLVDYTNLLVTGRDRCFKHISRWASLQKEYEWVVWLSPDETLLTGGKKLATAADILELPTNVDVLNPRVRTFWPDKDWNLDWYEEREIRAPRVWRRELSYPMPLGLHRHPHGEQRSVPGAEPWPEGTRIDHSWWLHHYPLRSPKQVERKMKWAGTRLYYKKRKVGDVSGLKHWPRSSDTQPQKSSASAHPESSTSE